MKISTRCGQDSDRNPASAGDILETMLGYNKIPEYWKVPLYPVEDMDFLYTAMSLNDVYSIGAIHAIKNLKRNGANIMDDIIEIPFEEIEPVRLEVGFKMEMYVDGELVEEFVMPKDYRTRKCEVAWKYQLPEGKHQVKIKVLNAEK